MRMTFIQSYIRFILETFKLQIRKPTPMHGILRDLFIDPHNFKFIYGKNLFLPVVVTNSLALCRNLSSTALSHICCTGAAVHPLPPDWYVSVLPMYLTVNSGVSGVISSFSFLRNMTIVFCCQISGVFPFLSLS